MGGALRERARRGRGLGQRRGTTGASPTAAPRGIGSGGKRRRSRPARGGGPSTGGPAAAGHRLRLARRRAAAAARQRQGAGPRAGACASPGRGGARFAPRARRCSPTAATGCGGLGAPRGRPRSSSRRGRRRGQPPARPARHGPQGGCADTQASGQSGGCVRWDAPHEVRHDKQHPPHPSPHPKGHEKNKGRLADTQARCRRHTPPAAAQTYGLQKSIRLLVNLHQLKGSAAAEALCLCPLRVHVVAAVLLQPLGAHVAGAMGAPPVGGGDHGGRWEGGQGRIQGWTGTEGGRTQASGGQSHAEDRHGLGRVGDDADLWCQRSSADGAAEAGARKRQWRRRRRASRALPSLIWVYQLGLLTVFVLKNKCDWRRVARYSEACMGSSDALSRCPIGLVGPY